MTGGWDLLIRSAITDPEATIEKDDFSIMRRHVRGTRMEILWRYDDPKGPDETIYPQRIDILRVDENGDPDYWAV